MARHEFNVWFNTESNDLVDLYVPDAERAAEVMKKLTHSMAPIYFVELETKAGHAAFINLANVSTIFHLGEVTE